MRTRNKAFLSCLVLAGVALAAAGAMAQVPPPLTKSCAAGAFTVTASDLSVVGSPSASYTEIQYTVSGAPGDFAGTDHVGALAGVGVAYVKAWDAVTNGWVACGSACQINPTFQGDNLTGLGKAAAHEQAVRVNPNDAKSTSFLIGVAGVRQRAATTVLVKKGKAVNSCRILGIGDVGEAVEIAPVVESYTHGGCTLTITMEKKTGSVLSAVVEPTTCDFHIDDIEVSINGGLAKKPNFGKGYVESGTGSCTTYFWGGRAYSFGSPCPD